MKQGQIAAGNAIARGLQEKCVMNDIVIHLDPDSTVPRYTQIYEYLKAEIQNGGLPSGQRLPSTRYLSGYLQVSRTTVEMAYEQLLSEGYIESVPYRGYFVCRLDGLYQFQPEQTETSEPEVAEKDSACIDFSLSGVDLKNFPHHTWRKLSRQILVENTDRFFQLGDPQGEPELRKVIAQYLHQARGMHVSPERIVVGAGNDFLLLLLCNMLGTDRVYAMESPTYRKAYDLLRNLSNHVIPVTMDENGICVDALEKSDCQIAYVMPSHQFPLGTVMPVRRRLALLEWANAREDRYIIEDDYDSEFRYRGKPIPALQGFDRTGRVIYIGTFSKSIAPAIRVSYLVLPERLMSIYRKKGKMLSSTVSRVDQMLIANFLKGGYFERHLNKMRAVYKSRHDTLLEELRVFEPIARISGENAGVHILLTFTNGMTQEEAVRRAAREGVRVYGLSRYLIAESSNAASAGHVETVESGRATLENFAEIGRATSEEHAETAETGRATSEEHAETAETGRATSEEHAETAETGSVISVNCVRIVKNCSLNERAGHRSALLISDREQLETCTVLLGYANIEEDEIHKAAALLRRAWLP